MKTLCGKTGHVTLRLRAVTLTSAEMIEPMQRFQRLLLALFPTLIICSANAAIVINEIHYNPDVKTERAEFIELYNNSPTPVDLSGWKLEEGIEFTFPGGTQLGANAYLLIAEDPATLLGKYNASALGPWFGKLENDGERIRLVNAGGGVEDEVSYGLGFPWPTVGDPPGYSIELIHPDLDNDLGGSWRASIIGNTPSQNSTLIQERSVWRFFRGYDEASSPTTAWRALSFDDSGWEQGAAPVGYDPSLGFGTHLDDMRYSYTTVFFRSNSSFLSPAKSTNLCCEHFMTTGSRFGLTGTPYETGPSTWRRVNCRFLTLPAVLGRTTPLKSLYSTPPGRFSCRAPTFWRSRRQTSVWIQVLISSWISNSRRSLAQAAAVLRPARQMSF
jgi:hypothetical protein